MSHSKNPLTKHIRPVWSVCCDECAVRDMLDGNLDEVAAEAARRGYRELDGRSLCKACYAKGLVQAENKEE